MSGATGQGLSALRRFVPHVAVLSDFDGTLARIVSDPGSARPLAPAGRVLASLARGIDVVGVVSGRPAAFLLEHLADAGRDVRLFGLYGLEWVEDGAVRTIPEAAQWADPVAGATASALRRAPSGVSVEPKGLTLGLHWRLAAEREASAAWAADFAREWTSNTGLVAHAGRLSLELRPPLPVDKGAVVERLAQGLRAACFIGDDAGDLPAFLALDRLAKTGCFTLRVAVVDPSGESPAELADSADVVVRGPEEALSILSDLSAYLGA